jgi:hypothetical protein
MTDHPVPPDPNEDRTLVPPSPPPEEAAVNDAPGEVEPREVEPSDVAAGPASASRSTRSIKVLSILVVVAGLIMMAAGVVTWFVVRDQLADEKIVVSEDAPFLTGEEVNGPFSAYAQAEAINDHALEASGGLTYAELDREDPVRNTVMTASFLRASLFTSVVAFGIAAFAFAAGILLIMIGVALLRVERILRT